MITMWIIETWLKITDISSTKVGEHIDDLFFLILGVVILIVIGSKWFDLATYPFLNSVEKQVANKDRPPLEEICCDNCMHFNHAESKCERTSRIIEDSAYRSCNFYHNLRRERK